MARFLNLQQMLDVNQNESEQMGQKINQGMQKDINEANHAIQHVRSGDPYGLGAKAPTEVAEASAKLAMSGNQAGRAAMLGPGANSLDAFLAGQSKSLTGNQQRYGNLMGRLQSAEQTGADRQAQLAARQQAAPGPSQPSALERVEEQARKRREKLQAEYDEVDSRGTLSTSTGRRMY